MRTHETQAQADLQALVASLFQRFPALVGFSIDEASRPDLRFSHVVTFPGYIAPTELMNEIAVPLLELLEEEPDARELLRGRTFARSLH